MPPAPPVGGAERPCPPRLSPRPARPAPRAALGHAAPSGQPGARGPRALPPGGRRAPPAASRSPGQERPRGAAEPRFRPASSGTSSPPPPREAAKAGTPALESPAGAGTVGFGGSARGTLKGAAIPGSGGGRGSKTGPGPPFLEPSRTPPPSPHGGASGGPLRMGRGVRDARVSFLGPRSGTLTRPTSSAPFLTPAVARRPKLEPRRPRSSVPPPTPPPLLLFWSRAVAGDGSTRGMSEGGVIGAHVPHLRGQERLGRRRKR